MVGYHGLSRDGSSSASRQYASRGVAYARMRLPRSWRCARPWHRPRRRRGRGPSPKKPREDPDGGSARFRRGIVLARQRPPDGRRPTCVLRPDRTGWLSGQKPRPHSGDGRSKPHVHGHSDSTDGLIPGPTATPPFHRITVNEYERIIEAGALEDPCRVELIDGYMVDKMGKNAGHSYATRKPSRRWIAGYRPDGRRGRKSRCEFPGMTSRSPTSRSFGDPTPITAVGSPPLPTWHWWSRSPNRH